jgi:superfamily II DNA/RNA helicase
MVEKSKTVGSELLIVDNSNERWKVANYLSEWCEISKRVDIATGNFEIGGLLALKDIWQKVDEIRILMGDTTSLRTKQAFEQAIETINSVLDVSLENEKLTNNFLTGVPAIVEGIKSKKINCRVYRKGRFHAKAYITHARSDVIGAYAIVGSSNLSKPGLTENIELNVQIVGPPVHALQDWYEEHWADGEDVSPEILSTIERHVAEYSPFEIYAKALKEFFRGHEMTANEWEESKSQMFDKLDRYQKEAYWTLMKIARQHGGAFLCDGVGLGKTFVGLMLIERLILHEGKRVLLFAPKATKDAVWVPHLRSWLPHIGGVSGGADFSNLAVFSHTDLNRKGDFPDRFKRIAELADVVIIDEAHHFRNPGRKGNGEVEPSRYYKLFDILDNSVRQKTLYMLTATPINNRLTDFRHMLELFTRMDESYFGRVLGIHNLRAHFNNLEKKLQKKIGSEGSIDLSDKIVEAQDFISTDKIFEGLVVQRSRVYAKQSQMIESGNSAVFPERKAPKVASYSIRSTYGELLDMFEQAFQRDNPLFTLPLYYPLHWYTGSDASIDPMEEGRQKQVVGLIRTMFLKRFESSICSFEFSCERLLKKLMAFLEIHSETDAEKSRFERWIIQHEDVLGFVAERQNELFGDPSGEEEVEEDILPQELLDSVERLDRKEYEVVEMIQETYFDLDNLVRFLNEIRKFEPKNDDKLKKLIRLLKSKELDGQKVLIFTEFADTARYLYRQLKSAGIDGVEQIDSVTKTNRALVIRRFAPYYNESSSAMLAEKNEKEIRVLISTDVLSEGLNLQDATFMINYDIHWNPVRLMQRIGRVDRRMNPAIEKEIIADHPEVEANRGKVTYWNFLPPAELNKILSLYTRVTQKTLLISKTLGIEGKKLLRPEDDFDALKDLNHKYEGKKTVIEDMHLEYQELLAEDQHLLNHLERLPGATFSGREKPKKGTTGVFFCYALPALDKETNQFSEEAGNTQWYLYDIEKESILEEPNDIITSIRSKPDTKRVCSMEKVSLSDVRAKVEKHIKNTYLKKVDAPIGVRPILKCWMEIN